MLGTQPGGYQSWVTALLPASKRLFPTAALVLVLACGAQAGRQEGRESEANDAAEIDSSDPIRTEPEPEAEPTSAPEPNTQEPPVAIESDAGLPDSDPCLCPATETSVVVNVERANDDAGGPEVAVFSTPHPESEWAGTCGSERIHSRLELGCGARLGLKVCAGVGGALPCLELRGRSVTYTDVSGATYSGMTARNDFTYAKDPPDAEDHVIEFGFVVDVSNGEGTLHLEGGGLICGETVLVPLVC